MTYKIAVASSDGVNIDLSFGAAGHFDIYSVDKTEYRLTEKRTAPTKEESKAENICGDEKRECNSSCSNNKSCGADGKSFPKVEMLSDCRCIICKKIGFNITKQLEKKAITSFDVDCTVEEALKKVTDYFNKIDNHISLRKSAE